MNDQTENAVDEKKEVLTEVTSIAQEEERTGVKQKLPSPEELVKRANVSFIQKRQMLASIWPKLSKKATLRVLAAGLDIPTGDIPVLLRTEEEQLCFGLLQRIQHDRFIIIQNQINNQILELRTKKEENKENAQEL